MAAVFRPYSSSDALRSDRSATDRQRHRHKVRAAIRENIADIVSEESIIGQSRDKIVKVPIRGIREYRFVYGDNSGGVGSGDGGSERGQVVGKAGPGQEPGAGPAGNQPGVDYNETDITLDELVNIMFEDLELPELERKKLRKMWVDSMARRKGTTRAGIRVHLDRRKTVVSRIKRKAAKSRLAGGPQGPGASYGPPAVEPVAAPAQRFPFHRDDLRYKRLHHDERPHSNAVVLCIMDTSGSMDTLKKYLARSFFFLLFQFVRTKYQHCEVVFIAHDTEGKEVTEEEFFHKGESGGTCISSGYQKALEIVTERFHPSLWNVYAFHCSDGDNFSGDNEAAMKAASGLCEVCNLFGYGEIKPQEVSFYSSSMVEQFEKLKADNFALVKIADKSDVWPSFKKFLQRDRVTD